MAYNTFISHVHENDAEVQQLKSLLTSRGHDIRDASIDSTRPNNATNEDYIKREILAPRISWAGTLVVLIGPNTHTSDYVNWEIAYANKLGKRIVGVFIRGGKESDLPENFERYGSALVGWNSDRLIGAIAGEHDDWCVPSSGDGEVFVPREPKFQVTRIKCQ